MNRKLATKRDTERDRERKSESEIHRRRLTMYGGSSDCRDATLITFDSIKKKKEKKRIKEKNEVGAEGGLLVTAS